MKVEIKIIPIEKYETTLALFQQLNTKTPLNILKQRVEEMFNQNYECVGLFLKNELIAITGIWYMTRHYIGKSAELDHVILDKKHQNKGYGKIFMQKITAYLKNKGVDACELNTYTQNRKSHKFYYNQDFEIYGFHFFSILRDDKEFY